MIVFKYFMKTG